jgi:hypothetical protein
MVKGFSTKEGRNVIELKFFCFTPKGKEKIVKIYFSKSLLKEFITKLEKSIESSKEGEEISYIG